MNATARFGAAWGGGALLALSLLVGVPGAGAAPTDDKPYCERGGVWAYDTDNDGNNGCGNDDDFEDDNNGNCGKGRREAPADEPVAGFGAPEEEPAEEPEPAPAAVHEDPEPA